MFHLLRRGIQHPARAICDALVKDGLPAGVDPTTFGILEEHGKYAGRRVRYVRVFDAPRATMAGLQPRSFGDLDRHPELVIAAGHVEQNGAVVFTRRQVGPEVPAAPRDRADRAAHADDERHVFPNGSSSRAD